MEKLEHSARIHKTLVTPFGRHSSESATIAATRIVSHTASRLVPKVRSAPSWRLSQRKNSSICQRFL